MIPHSLLDLARRKMGEAASRYGIPAKLGWKSTDASAMYTGATGGPQRYKVRMGQAGEQRVIAVAYNLGIPDVYNLDLSIEIQDGTLVIVGWDESAPILPPAGGLSCAECCNIQGGGIGHEWADVSSLGANESVDGSSTPPLNAIAVLSENAYVFVRQVWTGSANVHKLSLVSVDGAGEQTAHGLVDLPAPPSGHVRSYVNLARIDNSRFIAVYRLSRSSPASVIIAAVIGTVSGSSITLGSEFTVFSGTGIVRAGAGVASTIDASTILVSFTEGTSAFFRNNHAILSYSGSTITAIGTVAQSSSYSTSPLEGAGAQNRLLLAPFGSGLFLFRNQAVINNVFSYQYVLVSVSGTTATIDDEWDAGSSAAYMPTGNPPFLYQFGQDTTTEPGKALLRVRLIELSGTTFTEGTWLYVSPELELSFPIGSLRTLAYLGGDYLGVQGSGVLYGTTDYRFYTYLLEADWDNLTLSEVGTPFESPYTPDERAAESLLASGAFDGLLVTVLMYWDINNDPYELGFLSLFGVGGAGDLDCLCVDSTVALPDLVGEPSAPATGALIYAFGGVARVVDANGARDL